MKAEEQPADEAVTGEHRPQRLSREDLIPNRALGKKGSDAFQYAPIAGRVAETLTLLDPPLTVGLFGPWGSGKSSMFELIDRELPKQSGSPLMVKYDASTYGGEALKRNFISHIAADLGYDRESEPDFHTGLYESRRETTIDLGKLKEGAWPAIQLFLGAYLGFLLVACLLVGVTSLATDEDFLGEIARNIPKLIAPTAVAGLVLVVARALLDGGTVDTDQAQPATDEEFSLRFRSLVERGIKDKKFDRLVVFVDELDRCSSQDVVATLTAIRTFLDEKHCVFVVAADRAALERALEKELPQPTPVDEEDPYYSSASSFFDKVFHDRVPLPALRGQRLYEYAHDQVKDRGGFWKELIKADEGGRTLRRVLYVLIPSHVRAPRRVNILLNSFVRSASIADHRNFEWKERARELAKLTVLETEFPALADDLRTEPRLLKLILDPPATPSARLQRLLKKHGSDYMKKPAAERAREAQDDYERSEDEVSSSSSDEATSDTVIASATPHQRRAMTRAEREYLRRYLTRTQDVVIGRDLLFLEPAGAVIGIEDSELSDLLDRAIDEPEEVVDTLRERDAETQRLAARVLANMADNEFAEEATNAMTALLEVVEELGPEVEPVAHELVGSLRGVDEDEGLDDNQLVGGLALALAAKDGGLQTRFLDDGALFSDVGRTQRVALMLDRLPSGQREKVWAAVAHWLDEDDPAPLLEGLRHVSGPTAAELLEGKDVPNAIENFLARGEDGDEDRDGLMKVVYEAGDRDGGDAIRQAAQWQLLRNSRNFALVREHAESVMNSLPEGQVRDSHALLGLKEASFDEWPFWQQHLSSVKYTWPSQGTRATSALATRVSDFHGKSEEERQAFVSLVKALTPFVSLAPETQRESLRQAVSTQLEASAWWTSEELLKVQAQLHSAARHLAANEGSAVRQLLVADLVRAPLTPTEVTPLTLRGLRQMGAPLMVHAREVLDALEGLGASGTEPHAAHITLTRATLAASAISADADTGAGAVQMDELVAAISGGGLIAGRVAAQWLRLKPNPDAVLRLVSTTSLAATGQVADAATEWARSQSAASRTEFAVSLVSLEMDVSTWLSALNASGLDEEEVVMHIADTALAAGSAPRRKQLVAALVAMHPSEPAAERKVADLIIGLLERGTQADYNVATQAIPALGTKHSSGGRLRSAFVKAADDHGHQLKQRSLEQLDQAGVKVPQKSAEPKAVKALKKVAGFFR